MWTIERRHESGGARATRWVPVPGRVFGTQEEAARAVREAVQGQLRQGDDGRGRTDRFRVVPVVETCAVMQ